MYLLYHTTYLIHSMHNLVDAIGLSYSMRNSVREKSARDFWKERRDRDVGGYNKKGMSNKRQYKNETSAEESRV